MIFINNIFQIILCYNKKYKLISIDNLFLSLDLHLHLQ